MRPPASTTSPRGLLCLVTAVFLRAAPASSRTTFLWAAAPAGGVTAVSVDSMRAGAAAGLTNTSLDALAATHVAQLAYDGSSGHVIAYQERPPVLLAAPVCRIEPGRAPPTPSVVFNISSTLFPLYDPYSPGAINDCRDCRAGPFGLFDNKVYFLVTGVLGPAAPLTRQVVQLRVLAGCDACRVDAERAGRAGKDVMTRTLFNCSSLIATVVSEPHDPQVDVHLKSGQSLKVIKTEIGLQFFFQVFITRRRRRQHAPADLTLFRVTDSGEVHVIHTETVDVHYATWNIRGMASVDYKDGLLCWTAGDRLFCGQMDYTWRLLGSMMLLFPGEGAALEICTGPTPDLLLYITGVAISEAWNVWGERVIFFGCYAQWKGLGGTGMIKMRLNGKNKQVHRVLRTERADCAVHSGSMFVTHEVPDRCSPMAGDIDICLEKPEWVNQPQHLLRDNPEASSAEPKTTDFGYKVHTSNSNSEVHTPRRDPEIIVVDIENDLDFASAETVMNGKPAKSIYLHICTIILLLVMTFLP